jgi:hypothetical protein
VARATVCLGHSATLHSHGKPPPYFVGPGLATQALIRACKNVIKQSERYAKVAEIFGESYVNNEGKLHPLRQLIHGRKDHPFGQNVKKEKKKPKNGGSRYMGFL